MAEFRLSNLGKQFKEDIVSSFENIIKIDWELVDYNLKTNTISGDLEILVARIEEDGVDNFNKLKVTLLLSDMDVDVGRISIGHRHDIGAKYTARYIMRTSVSLDDFPEIALGNYIKDAQETLSYEWSKNSND
tara:strand:+ start:2575 stop:2973 length:399 start_codon:yes stop_codon:yes gene_type:complete